MERHWGHPLVASWSPVGDVAGKGTRLPAGKGSVVYTINRSLFKKKFFFFLFGGKPACCGAPLPGLASEGCLSSALYLLHTL